MSGANREASPKRYNQQETAEEHGPQWFALGAGKELRK